MSLADRIIPAEALRWGTLTRCWPWHATHDLDPMNVPPGVIVTRMSDGRPPWEQEAHMSFEALVAKRERRQGDHRHRKDRP